MRVLLAVVLLLSACTAPTVVKERVERASVPVAVGCIDGERPPHVGPLSATHSPSEWAALTPKQKAALVAAQGQRHQSRGEAIDAATGACR